MVNTTASLYNLIGKSCTPSRQILSCFFWDSISFYGIISTFVFSVCMGIAGMLAHTYWECWTTRWFWIKVFLQGIRKYVEHIERGIINCCFFWDLSCVYGIFPTFVYSLRMVNNMSKFPIFMHFLKFILCWFNTKRCSKNQSCVCLWWFFYRLCR